jgi:hypothetical protein
VTFRSNKFNTSESKPNYINPCSFGDDAAEWLAKQLTNSGVTVDPKIGQEDFGWYLGFQCGAYLYHFVLGYNPDGYWMGWLERQRGLLGNLFGARKKGIRPDAANAIHSTLVSSAVVSDVRWHQQKDFDGLREDLGTRTPLD